jgi:hypothetical protein
MVYDIEVVDTGSKRTAADMLSTIAAIRNAMEMVTERFRGPAHAHYKSVLAQKKALLDPPDNAIKILKDKITAYDAKVEEELASAKLGMLLGEEGADEALHRATEAREAPIAGVTTRTYWKAECEDLTALCRAVADGVAPLELVSYNESAGNKLAARLRKAMMYPGIKVYKEKVTARSKR